MSSGRYIVFDEPASGLDVGNIEKLKDALLRYYSYGPFVPKIEVKDNSVHVDIDVSTIVSQDGAGNRARVDQSGSYNIAWIDQSGNANDAGITQDGYGNSAKIIQKGSGNRANITQYGTQKTAVVVQKQSQMAVNVIQH